MNKTYTFLKINSENILIAIDSATDELEEYTNKKELVDKIIVNHFDQVVDKITSILDADNSLIKCRIFYNNEEIGELHRVVKDSVNLTDILDEQLN